MAIYEGLVKSHIGQVSGRPPDEIDLSSVLESYLAAPEQQQIVFALMESIEHKRPTDPETEEWLVVEPTTSGTDLLHYVSYLAGDPDYPRPRPGK
jgi:hypothetical protein